MTIHYFIKYFLSVTYITSVTHGAFYYPFFILIFPSFTYCHKNWRFYTNLSEGLLVIGVDAVRPFGVKLDFRKKSFSQIFQDSQWYFGQGTGCVVTTCVDLLQLMSLFHKYSKLQPPIRVPAHFHVQKQNFVVCYDFNLVLFLEREGGGINLSSFCC